MSDLYFKECPTCNVKPGSPVLCNSCLHNRRVISKLSELLKSRDNKLDVLKKVLEL